MYLLGDALVTSASDLKLASDCEFAFLREFDRKLGWSDDEKPAADAMLARAAMLGDRHELDWLDGLKREHGAGVVELPKPTNPTDPDELRQLAKATADALDAQAPVVFQAVFFDDADAGLPFIGFADFLVRQPSGGYRVVDTKLSRHVRVTALLQLAAYHEQLQRMGLPTDEVVELRLGDRRAELTHIDEIAPVFRARRRRMHHLIREHRSEGRAVAWGDDRYGVDGRCGYCAPAAQAAYDLIGIAGMMLTQRSKLRAAGVTTLAQLASTARRPDACSIPERTYARLHLQARLQWSASDASDIPVEVIDPKPLRALPEPNDGDLFFDFEGDPMYVEPGRHDAERWGLDYLFGWVDAAGEFDCLWAHDQREEREALRRFVEFVEARRAEHPEMRIYHYASYEKTHLLGIAARHGESEHVIDQWLHDGLLVDLYPVMRSAMRIGVPSYSIKKLEPLYMGAELRREDGVTNAGDSIAEYVRAREAIDRGDDAEGRRILDDIADYNRYDCRSTLQLRAWLLSQPEAQGPRLERGASSDRAPYEPSPLEAELNALADSAPDANASRAYRLAAAAVDFHQRERKRHWWAHFDRLVQPADEWESTRGVFTIVSAEVERTWHREGKQRKDRRILRLHGEWAPGSGTPKPGDVHVLYDEDDAPALPLDHQPGARVARKATVLDPAETDDGALRLEEVKGDDDAEWHTFPTHVAPGDPLRTASIEEAITGWGSTLVDLAPDWPTDAMAPLLLGQAPKVDGGIETMHDADDGVRAVVASLRRMPNGTLAVQGPPGTGKTHLASHVIAELVVRHHWTIGVVAQSHKVVEHVLDAVARAGLDRRLVGKAIPDKMPANHYDGNAFSVIPKDAHSGWARERSDSGCVFGGTAWDFTNRKRVGAGSLDLLVVEEAGQYSLANTIAAATASPRLLLLGDPQQLPQVTQGSHPAPVGDSALGHVIGGLAVMPDDLGYFLAESRRMDAALSELVSTLSYDGQLRSHASTSGRSLEGVAPGLHSVSVEHEGDSTESIEEARHVVDLVQSHLGRNWVAHERAEPKPLTSDDLIVVTPYNAQVERIRAALRARATASGASELALVQVGTVDKFQGREAVIAIVSLAASSAADVPRGIEFLLSRNRLNVSISRAKWAAYLVHSPALTEHLPTTPAGVATLSRFIRLLEDATD